ncbi:MAG: sugar transferase [Pseudomonadota bacterium]
MIRFFDILLSATGLVVLSPLLLFLLIIGWLDTRAPLFCYERVGQYQKSFVLIKFRTMRLGAPVVASHLADASAITRWGHFLRHFKLDELPQLFNVLKGEMSMVGPRPCLRSQADVIEQRAKHGIYDVRPGITGLAQMRGIDSSRIRAMVAAEAKMMEKLNLRYYFWCIIVTVLGKGVGDQVR